MDFTDDAIVLSTRRHGESDAILSALTRAHGRHMGLIKGGASRRQRPVLEIGNRLTVHWRARLEEQLGNYQVEAQGSGGGSVSAGLFDDPLRLAGLAAACAVADIVLPERQPHEDVFDATAVLIAAITGEAGATSWPSAYVHWELQLLTALGFGLDLSHCAATGETTDLEYVSPKTGRAVSRAAGKPYADRLLALPRFLTETDARATTGLGTTGPGTTGRGTAGPDVADLMAGLRLTGYFLDRHVLHGPHPPGSATERRLEARARFLERLAGAD